MLNTSFRSRQNTIDSWNPIFQVAKKELYSFLVNIHGVSILFKTDQKSLIKELQLFFPKDWQKESSLAIEVTWVAPVKKLLNGLNWDDISDPDCFFENDFISQRDFLAKKISESQYELIANQTIDDGLFNFLRYLLPLSLLEEKKVLFHSSCVVNKSNEAYLFFGPSGAGKTTISSLCLPEANILGDDMNILSSQEGQVFVEAAAVGQRFYDKKNFGQKYTLKKAFWLMQGDANQHQLMSSGVLKYYLSSFANLFWNQLDDSRYQKVFQFAGDLKENLPLYQLTFKKDKEVWNYVQSIR